MLLSKKAENVDVKMSMAKVMQTTETINSETYGVKKLLILDQEEEPELKSVPLTAQGLFDFQQQGTAQGNQISIEDTVLVKKEITESITEKGVSSEGSICINRNSIDVVKIETMSEREGTAAIGEGRAVIGSLGGAVQSGGVGARMWQSTAATFKGRVPSTRDNGPPLPPDGPPKPLQRLRKSRIVPSPVTFSPPPELPDVDPLATDLSQLESLVYW